MNIINIIWVSFLLTIIVFFILYSIFSKNKDDMNIENGNIYENFSKKRKNKKPKFNNKKNRPEPEIVVKKPSSSELKRKKIPKQKSKDLSKSEYKPKIKSKISNKPNDTNTKKDKSNKVDNNKDNKNNNNIKKDGLEFKGQFDDKEVEFLKRYAHKNRGFVTQKLNDKVVAKRWLKTKRTYDMLMNEISNKKDKNGNYKTYVIWNNKVDKYLLKNKIK